MQERIAKMTDNVAQSQSITAAEDDAALAMVDQAFDSMIAAIAIIEENLPNVKTETVPQAAAKAAITDLMDTAIAPYTVDAVRALEALGAF